MPRRTHRIKVFRTRVKTKGNFRSYLLSSSSKDGALTRSVEGRILSITKVSPEEIGKFGAFFSLGDQLLKEFRSKKSIKEVVNGRTEESRGIHTPDWIQDDCREIKV